MPTNLFASISEPLSRLSAIGPGEALLPPRLVKDDGYRVGQVQAAITGAHRDEDTSVLRHGIDQGLGKTARLGAK